MLRDSPGPKLSVLTSMPLPTIRNACCVAPMSSDRKRIWPAGTVVRDGCSFHSERLMLTSRSSARVPPGNGSGVGVAVAWAAAAPLSGVDVGC